MYYLSVLSVALKKISTVYQRKFLSLIEGSFSVFDSFCIDLYTEKYREFQARFSLFSILFLTEQFRNGALSVTHQRMITITLRGAIMY